LKAPKLLIDTTALIGTFTTIGDEGFGYSKDSNGVPQHKEHEFGVIIHENVVVGSHCSIHRGRWRDTVINSGTKIDSHTHIAHNVIIGKNCIIGPHVSILGSVEIGDNCEIWSGSIIHQGVKIGDNSVVGANTYLRNDISGMVVYNDIPKPKLVNRNMTKMYGKQEGGVSRKTCLNGKCAANTDW